MTQILISEECISLAWGRIFQLVVEQKLNPLTPALISIENFERNQVLEVEEIRTELDEFLVKQDKHSSDITARTIFPYKYWLKNLNSPRSELYRWYMQDMLPRIKALGSINSNGTYFERMIDFKVEGELFKETGKSKNQLEHIIKYWEKYKETGVRQAALQISCLDPFRDLNFQKRRGFPCLQQVSFVFDTKLKQLAVNAYYPTQYIVSRAYGNYLGLCFLGHFVAHEMEMQLEKVNCYIGQPKLGIDTKKGLSRLEEVVDKYIKI